MDTFIDKNLKHLRMEIDNPERLISIWTDNLIQIETDVTTEGDDFSCFKKGTYRIAMNAPQFKKPIGKLLFSFINADFTNQKGFKEFISIWGLPGLLELNNNLDYDFDEYSEEKYKNIVHSFYNLTKDRLIDAQDKFKQAIDFCINSGKQASLEGLTPLQRFYVGVQKYMIDSLEDYSDRFFTTHDVVRNYSNCSDKQKEVFTEHEYTFEQLCSSVKDDTLEIKTIYSTQNIITFVYLEFFNLLTNFSIGKCENCGKYFVPITKITEIYCEDCRHVGYLNKIKSDKFLKAYNTAYKTKHAQKQRKTYGKGQETKNKYKDALKKWREEAKSKLEAVQKGEITEEKFKDFLDKELEV